MNRYSAGNTVVNLGAFAAPLLPLWLLSGIQNRSSYFATPLDILLLWLVGLGVSVALILVHELGHTIAAKLVGIGINEISIGHWKKLFSLRVAGMAVTIRAAPSTGYVRLAVSKNNFSVWRMSVVLLAGIAAELVLVVVTALVAPPTLAAHTLGRLVLSFCVVCVYCFATLDVFGNLLPRESAIAGDPSPNDGLQLVRLWRNRKDPKQITFLAEWQEIQSLMRDKNLSSAIARVRKLVTDHPDNPELPKYLATLQAENGDSHASEAYWRSLLQGDGLSPGKTAEILDSLCCLPIYYGRTDLLPEAERWIGEALNHVPDAITLKGTKGSILVEQGRIEEAIPLLRDVLRRSECGLDHAISAAYLAKAHALQGDLSTAKNYLARAQKANPDHIVVKRIAQELSAQNAAV